MKVLVFDTTASNSGIHKGTAAILERDQLGHKIIWAGCRKHVAELLVKLIFGESKSASYSDFVQYQSAWLKKPSKDDGKVLERAADGVKVEFVTDWENIRGKEVCKELSAVLNSRNKNNLLPRDDYKELLELALLLNPYALGVKHTIKKPGAHHMARWMCVCIYALKMVWFQHLAILNYSPEYKSNLLRFVKFLLLIYIPYWLKVTLRADAAVHDLILYKQLLQYNDIDRETSQASLRALSRHYLYLVPESIILWSLFGTELDQDQKGRIAASLLTKPKPDTWKPKMVKFPIITPNTTLLSPLSWFPFSLLNLSSEWLESPPSQWEKDPDYKVMEKFAKTVKLVNDVAERGVKMADDYSNCFTKDSEKRKKLVMAVQNHRRTYLKLRKVDLCKRFTDVDQDKVDVNMNNIEADNETVETLSVEEWSDSDTDDYDY